MAVDKPNQDGGNGEESQSESTTGTSQADKLYISKPAMGVIEPPDWPPRPDIFDEVVLRKPMTPERAHDAYMAWFLPDQDLGRIWRKWDQDKSRPYLRPPDNDLDLHILAHNVYEHLMSDPLLPMAYEDGPRISAEQGLNRQYDLAENMRQTKQAAVDSGSLGFLDFLDFNQLREECRKRGLDTRGTAAELQSRIIAETMNNWSGMLVQTDISHWGVHRSAKFALEPWDRPRATALQMYTAAIQISPYNPTYWVSRAYCHYLLGFFDLAIGDAYRAQLLCDVLEQSSERNRRPGFYVRIWEAIEAHLMVFPRDAEGNLKPEVVRMRKPNGINAFVPTLQKSLHGIISLSLAGLNAWHDYDDYMKILDTRLGMPDRDVRVPQLRQILSRKAAKIYRSETQQKKKLFFHEHSAGAVPADRPYPFEKQDVVRTSPDFLDKLNKNIFGKASKSQKGAGPVCHADKVGELQELGVFAKTAIQKGAVIHIEEPTIRGHLPPRRLANDAHGKATDKNRCENCLKEITPAMLRQQKKSQNQCPCAEKWLRQPDTPGILFCKPNPRLKKQSGKGCLEIARELHHFSSCGKDWQWLYDTMRPVVSTWNGEEYVSHTNEGHGTTLMLLLRNVFEITLHRRKQESGDGMRLNPHEIDELLVLDGNSKSWRESWFPFNMAANIKVPFDILESLGVDIFQRPEFDTWIVQIILRKLLVNAVPWDPKRRGDVSDRMETDRDKNLLSPEAQFQRIKKKQPMTELDPSLANLYLFPGLSMFNHSCADSHNADWGYDKTIPNRVIVWATKAIAQGEEIRIRYQNHAMKSFRRAKRYFGGPCRCSRCLKNSPMPTTPDSENFSDQTFPSDEEPEPNPWEVQDKNWEPAADSDSSYSQSSSWASVDTLNSRVKGSKRPAPKERAVVEDGKVLIYRDLTTPNPRHPRTRKRKIEEAMDSSSTMRKMIVDENGFGDEVPSDPEMRAAWVRNRREELFHFSFVLASDSRLGCESIEGDFSDAPDISIDTARIPKWAKCGFRLLQKVFWIGFCLFNGSMEHHLWKPLQSNMTQKRCFHFFEFPDTSALSSWPQYNP